MDDVGNLTCVFRFLREGALDNVVGHHRRFRCSAQTRRQFLRQFTKSFTLAGT